MSRWSSPLKLVALAAFVVVSFGAAELAGGRSATSALSGAHASAGGLLFGAVYMLLWFASVLVAPPLVLTAAVLAALGWRRASQPASARLR